MFCQECINKATEILNSKPDLADILARKQDLVVVKDKTYKEDFGDFIFTVEVSEQSIKKP